ncbi:MAG TPA: phosphoribosyl-AMP cyclohydrolase [Rhodospirillales bacterium]|jgi:phosphoribosyl-AMP cyclohydrolase|nr:phosphoribosyl-AMP cyclohydrolase [Rhodospirillales bacterium]HIL74236.1 phosphoribosyl-AMP cyclohydrolase [Rhodospirillales bacterium]
MNEDIKSTIEQALATFRFNPEGLIPAIAQQFDTGEVLMMAWMNEEAISASFKEERVVYWSRSRQTLWRKGETSGQIQYLKEMRWDCDGDTLLVQVDQKGVACHTGQRSCFFSAVRDGKIKTISTVKIDPSKLYK